MARDASRRGARRHLRLGEQFQLVPISEQAFQLASLHDTISLSGPEGGVLGALLPALQRGAAIETLLEPASRKQRPAIRRTVRELISRGLVEELEGDPPSTGAAPDPFRAQRQFFANFQPVAGMDSDVEPGAPGTIDLQAELARATVMVAGLGRVGSRVCQALASAGVGHIVGVDAALVAERDLADSAYVRGDVGQPRTAALQRRVLGTAFSTPPADPFGPAGLPSGLSMVALCEDMFDPARHEAVNRTCLNAKLPWIGFRSHGTRVEIGPTVIPHETACYRCYELRRASNFEGFEAEQQLRARLARTDTGVGGLNITLGADLLALEIVKTLTHFTAAATYGAVYVLDVATMDSKLRPLLKIPRCPECGRSAQKPAVNIWRYDAEDEDGLV